MGSQAFRPGLNCVAPPALGMWDGIRGEWDERRYVWRGTAKREASPRGSGVSYIGKPERQPLKRTRLPGSEAAFQEIKNWARI